MAAMLGVTSGRVVRWFDSGSKGNKMDKRTALRRRVRLCDDGCRPFTISIHYTCTLGSKEVLLAKDLNLYLFLSVTKDHDWLK